MVIEITPFRAEYLDDCAVLLAARVQRDAALEPHLSTRLVDPAAARAHLHERLETANAGGIVALAHGRLSGYMLATRFPGPGVTAFPYRSARIAYHDHAATGEERGELYRMMYAVLSPAWLAAGFFCHVVDAPYGDRDLRDAWMSVGFGQILVWMRRAIAPAPQTRLPPDVAIRRGELGDVDAVSRLVSELFRHHANAPSSIPYLPEFEAVRRQAHEAGLAERGGATVGVAIFQPTPLPPMMGVVSEDAMYLADAHTEASARGGGIGTALLARGLAWAEAEGYAWCYLAVVSGNLVGERFWRYQGFEPYVATLVRVVDERIAWARG